MYRICIIGSEGWTPLQTDTCRETDIFLYVYVSIYQYASQDVCLIPDVDPIEFVSFLGGR